MCAAGAAAPPLQDAEPAVRFNSIEFLLFLGIVLALTPFFKGRKNAVELLLAQPVVQVRLFEALLVCEQTLPDELLRQRTLVHELTFVECRDAAPVQPADATEQSDVDEDQLVDAEISTSRKWYT